MTNAKAKWDHFWVLIRGGFGAFFVVRIQARFLLISWCYSGLREMEPRLDRKRMMHLERKRRIMAYPLHEIFESVEIKIKIAYVAHCLDELHRMQVRPLHHHSYTTGRQQYWTILTIWSLDTEPSDFHAYIDNWVWSAGTEPNSRIFPQHFLLPPSVDPQTCC